jgi:hypothetical protein
MSIPAFTFNVSDLTTALKPSNQGEWNGPCKPEVEDPFRKTKDDFHNWDADLSVGPISEITSLHVIGRHDEWYDEWHEELLAAEANGTNDATHVSTRPREVEEKLFVRIGLRPQRYELFRAFITLHFGRSDLICRIRGHVGFAPAGRRAIKWPTYDEFLKGRPYLNLEGVSVRFSSRLANRGL